MFGNGKIIILPVGDDSLSVTGIPKLWCAATRGCCDYECVLVIWSWLTRCCCRNGCCVSWRLRLRLRQHELMWLMCPEHFFGTYFRLKSSGRAKTFIIKQNYSNLKSDLNVVDDFVTTLNAGFEKVSQKKIKPWKSSDTQTSTWYFLNDLVLWFKFTKKKKKTRFKEMCFFFLVYCQE